MTEAPAPHGIVEASSSPRHPALRMSRFQDPQLVTPIKVTPIPIYV